MFIFYIINFILICLLKFNNVQSKSVSDEKAKSVSELSFSSSDLKITSSEYKDYSKTSSSLTPPSSISSLDSSSSSSSFSNETPFEKLGESIARMFPSIPQDTVEMYNRTPTSRPVKFKQQRRRKLRNTALYYNDCHPGVRAVKLCIEALNLDMKYIYINPYDKNNIFDPDGQYKNSLRDFYTINPTGILPALNDDKFIVTGSAPSMRYLVKLYGKKDVLYPKDIKKQATVDMRIQYFDSQLLPLAKNIVEKVIHCQYNSLTVDDLESVKKKLSYINNILMKTRWIAGDHLTIADFTYVALISTWPLINVMPDLNGYLHIVKWLKNCRDEIPGYGFVMDQSLAEVKATWDKKIAENRLYTRVPMQRFTTGSDQGTPVNEGPTHGNPMNQGPAYGNPMNQGPTHGNPMNQGPMNPVPIFANPMNYGPLYANPVNQGSMNQGPPINQQPYYVRSNNPKPNENKPIYNNQPITESSLNMNCSLKPHTS